MPDSLWTVEPTHLRSARQAVRGQLWPSPLIPLPALGRDVWGKLEGEMPTGSFKVRGALAALSMSEGAVVAASAGNHGFGLAWAARSSGRDVHIFVPSSTPDVKQDGMRSLGAEVCIVEGGYDEAEVAARNFADEHELAFISPYDDPLVAAGNGGTLADELAVVTRARNVEVIAPVGGGGLLAGLAATLPEHVTLLGAQSEACPAMRDSLLRGEAIEQMTGEPSIAEGLEGGVSAATLAAARARDVMVCAVTEAEIESAVVFAYESLGLTLEGSAAVALALHRAKPPAPSVRRVLILTGRNIDPSRLCSLLGAAKEAKEAASQLASEEAVVSGHTQGAHEDEDLALAGEAQDPEEAQSSPGVTVD